MHKFFTSLIALCFLVALPTASAHGALALNEFDTYAISDFEGQEESFVWEGFEIWDVYVGDGYNQATASHGVFFKVNVAGDGTIRPTGGASWDLQFSFNVGNATFDRWIAHDGADVTTDFEQLEWQIEDDNVFQVHAWVPITNWAEQSVSNLIVRSLVDGNLRDIAPGGIFDPATGTEIPVNVPASPVFPEMGEGRLVEKVMLTGASKYLDVTVTPEADGWFTFNVTNALTYQGQHFMFQSVTQPGWTLDGAPNAVSLDGSSSTSFRIQFQADPTQTLIEPMKIDLLTDIGGLQSFYAFVGNDGVQVVNDPAMAFSSTQAQPVEESPGLPLVWLALAMIFVARKRIA